MRSIDRLHGKNIDTLIAENLVLPQRKYDYIGRRPYPPNRGQIADVETVAFPKIPCRCWPLRTRVGSLPTPAAILRRKSVRLPPQPPKSGAGAPGVLEPKSQSTGRSRVGRNFHPPDGELSFRRSPSPQDIRPIQRFFLLRRMSGGFCPFAPRQAEFMAQHAATTAIFTA